jgi:NitT/TauT family transport system substrate-binding protein
VLDSYEVLGGPHTFNVVWATSKYYQENPKVVKAFVDALEDALQQIQADPAGAAKTWLQFEPSKITPELVESYIRQPQNEWTTTPKQVMAYAAFMNRTGVLKTKPQSWKDVFFDVIHSRPGS